MSMLIFKIALGLFLLGIGVILFKRAKEFFEGR